MFLSFRRVSYRVAAAGCHCWLAQQCRLWRIACGRNTLNASSRLSTARVPRERSTANKLAVAPGVNLFRHGGPTHVRTCQTAGHAGLRTSVGATRGARRRTLGLRVASTQPYAEGVTQPASGRDVENGWQCVKPRWGFRLPRRLITQGALARPWASICNAFGVRNSTARARAHPRPLASPWPGTRSGSRSVGRRSP